MTNRLGSREVPRPPYPRTTLKAEKMASLDGLWLEQPHLKYEKQLGVESPARSIPRHAAYSIRGWGWLVAGLLGVSTPRTYRMPKKKQKINPQFLVDLP